MPPHTAAYAVQHAAISSALLFELIALGHAVYNRRRHLGAVLTDFVIIITIRRGGDAGISQTDIFEITGISRRTIQRRLAILVRDGVIKRRGRARYTSDPNFVVDNVNAEIFDQSFRQIAKAFADLVLVRERHGLSTTI